MSTGDSLSAVTADGCAAVRASELARAAGVRDPYAAWFDGPEGRRLAEFAASIEPAYFEHNIARYLYTTKRLGELAARMRQLVVLGSGADGRGIWLEELGLNNVAVFEVDTAQRLAAKQKVLETHGVRIPERVSYVAGDLVTGGIPERLAAAGFEADRPAVVMLEGVVYLLPADVADGLLDPAWLNLAPGSELIFDYWSPGRVNAVNGHLRKRIGRELFQPGPFELDEVEARLGAKGFGRVRVTPIEAIASGFLLRNPPSDVPDGWVMVDCAV